MCEKCKHSKPLKIMYANADSLMNKFEEMCFRIKDSNYDIIAITEVKPKSARFNLHASELQIENYELYENLHTAGRGIVMYVDKSISSYKIDISNDFQEAIFISIKVNNAESLIAGCVYRSPNSTELNNDNLNELINAMSSNCKQQLIIMGDYNFPLINWNSYSTLSGYMSKEAKFLETVRDCYLIQKIKQPTRFRVNCSPSALDLLFVKQDDYINEVSYESPLGKSDHRVLSFEYQSRVNRLQYMKSKYFYDKADYDAINAVLANVNWHDEMMDKDTNGKWTVFKNTIEM